MNKKEMRKQALEKHYRSLELLAKFCRVANPDGKKLSLKLWKLELEANKAATDYCNGKRFCNDDGKAWEDYSDSVKSTVNGLFNNNLGGLMVNSDARGYALKIDDEVMRSGIYDFAGLHRDWGGYGILSPEIK